MGLSQQRRRDKRLTAQRELEEWFEKNNEGGFDFSCPPPRTLIEAAFPSLDDEEIDYLIRKPSRCFERFEE
jgi:hypothetical protein